MVQDINGDDVTEARWELVDACVKGFIRRYPLHWATFRADVRANETEYQLALEGDLRKSSFRNTLSFPVVMRRRTPAEVGLDPAGVAVEFVESLKEQLDRLIPGFTAPDEPGRPNRLYKEFIRRYGHLFRPGSKY